MAGISHNIGGGFLLPQFSVAVNRSSIDFWP